MTVATEPRMIQVDTREPGRTLTVVVADQGRGKTRAWILGPVHLVEAYMHEILDMAREVLADSEVSVPRALELIADGHLRQGRHVPDVVRMSALAVLQDLALNQGIDPLTPNLAAHLETRTMFGGRRP